MLLAKSMNVRGSPEPKIEMDNQIDGRTLGDVLLGRLASNKIDKRLLLVVGETPVQLPACWIYLLRNFFVDDLSEFKPIFLTRNRTQDVRVVGITIFSRAFVNLQSR